MTDRLKMINSISRRNVLKGAAGAAGLAVGSGAITGFPYVHSAEPKILRYLGTAVNEGDEISKKCLEDTGIKIEYITATTDDVTKRVITQPNSFDVLDTEYFSLKKLVPSGNIFRARRQEDQGIRQHHPGLHQRPATERQEDRQSRHGTMEGALS